MSKNAVEIATMARPSAIPRATTGTKRFSKWMSLRKFVLLTMGNGLSMNEKETSQSSIRGVKKQSIKISVGRLAGRRVTWQFNRVSQR